MDRQTRYRSRHASNNTNAGLAGLTQALGGNDSSQADTSPAHHQRNEARPWRNSQRFTHGGRAHSQMHRSQHNIMTGLSIHDLQNCTQIQLRLGNLTKKITVQGIQDSITKLNLGVKKIEILEKDGRRTGQALVTVEPPPRSCPRFCTIFDEENAPIESQIQIAQPTHSQKEEPARHQNTFRNEEYYVETPLGNNVPRQVTFKCPRLRLGMMVQEDCMLELPQENYQAVCLDVQFKRRFIEISFTLDLWGEAGLLDYKIPIKFSHIKKITRVKDVTGGTSLLIQLPSPPEVFNKPNNVPCPRIGNARPEQDPWMRQTDLPKIKSHPPNSNVDTAPAKLRKNHATTDLGRWTNYLLSLPAALVDDWVCTERHLEDYNISIEETDSFSLRKPSSRLTALDSLDNVASRSTLELLETHCLHLPFDVRYQLEACISQGLLNEYSIDDQFLQKLNSFGAERARMMLEGVADRNMTFYNPMDMFAEPQVIHYWPSVRVPSQAALIRKAVITPTTIYFKTPTVELTNRILRQYSHLTDRFLRVQFTDELTFGKVSSSQGLHRSDELYARVKRVLRNGIKVGDRLYKVLAWSSSQFREHGAFFFCPTDHVTCEGIRDLVGDLKHIRSVGKYAARMGQCLTTTRHVNGISVPKVVAIDEIHSKTGNRRWTFTDGVGKISLFNARMISNDHNLLEVPSCVQFRMGGCKGILVVWPDVPAHEVHIRPSQQKFLAVYNGLEIIKVSKYSQATLNSQTIPLLHCLGVPDYAFMDLLEEELKEYEEAMHTSTQAARLLQERIDENQVTLVIAEMVNVFMEAHEPFLWTLLRLWRCWALQRLKYKAAISIRKSAFVYGCVDETGTLRGYSERYRINGSKDENKLPQIFLQVPEQGTDSGTAKYKIITGLCLLGRNPSLHPGDVQIVQAVDVPQLRHLKNVVVFPQKGDRDLPSMCSGGDLDGDDFFVFWDERLLPSEWSYPPMDHDADTVSTNLNQSSDVTIEDMCDFFTEYMKNDSLGVIATSHKAWADKVGPKDSKCLELAALHSAAVDYVKSGKPAVMRRFLFPERYPHFMGRQKSYRSNKPLGLIFERVNVETFNPAYEMAFDKRILSRFDLSDEELTKARSIKSQYDIGMRRLMGQHEKAITEFEIWSTFILSKPRVGNDYKLQEAVGRDVSALKDRFRKTCAEAITGMPQNTSMFSYSQLELGKLDRFVAAMYTVTHQEVQDSLEARAAPCLDEDGSLVADEKRPAVSMPLISFPWLFHRELARIATGGRTSKQYRTVSSNIGKPHSNVQAPELPSSIVNADFRLDKVNNGNEVEDLLFFEDGNGDCTHTASGRVVHRGEILDLFDGKEDASPAAMSSQHEGNNEARAFADVSTVSPKAQSPADFEGDTVTQTPPEIGEEVEYEEAEFEEMELADEEDEDALEVLASKIAVTDANGEESTTESLL